MTIDEEQKFIHWSVFRAFEFFTQVTRIAEFNQAEILLPPFLICYVKLYPAIQITHCKSHHQPTRQSCNSAGRIGNDDVILVCHWLFPDAAGTTAPLDSQNLQEHAF